MSVRHDIDGPAYFAVAPDDSMNHHMRVARQLRQVRDFPAVLSKAAALRDTYNVTVLQQAKKLGKQLGQLEASGFAGAAFMDKDEVKIFAQQ